MSFIKGTSIDFIRIQIHKQGKQIENDLLSKLTSEESLVYQKAMQVSWVPVKIAEKIFQVGGTLLYPEEKEVFLRVGKELAVDNLKGIYKILIQITTVSFAFKQAVIFWKTYHKKGTPKVEKDSTRNFACFSVAGYPDFPSGLRQLIAGFILGVGELAGAKNGAVRLDESNPDLWKWNITWE